MQSNVLSLTQSLLAPTPRRRGLFFGCRPAQAWDSDCQTGPFPFGAWVDRPILPNLTPDPYRGELDALTRAALLSWY